MSRFAEAEAHIRQLHAHYTDAVWRKDPSAFADCFTADAEWRIAGMVLRGRHEITATIRQVLASANRVLVTVRTPQLELADDGAISRTYVTEQCTWSDKAPFTTIGCYHDRYAQEGGRWRFAWRLFQLHYKGPADLSGEFYDIPDFGPWPSMPRGDAVPDATPVSGTAVHP